MSGFGSGRKLGAGCLRPTSDIAGAIMKRHKRVDCGAENDGAATRCHIHGRPPR